MPQIGGRPRPGTREYRAQTRPRRPPVRNPIRNAKPTGVFAKPLRAPSFKPAQQRAQRNVRRAERRLPPVPRTAPGAPPPRQRSRGTVFHEPLQTHPFAAPRRQAQRRTVRAALELSGYQQLPPVLPGRAVRQIGRMPAYRGLVASAARSNAQFHPKHRGLLDSALRAVERVPGAALRYLTNQQAQQAVGGFRTDPLVRLTEARLRYDREHPLGPRSDSLDMLTGAVLHPRRTVVGLSRAEAQRSAQASVGGGDAISGVGRVVGATAEHPGKVGLATLKSVPQILPGLLAGPIMLAADPGRVAKGLEKDYGYRYGRKAGEAVQREGLIPYLLDAAVVAGPTLRAAGTAARLRPETRLGRVMNEPRLPLRFAESEGGVRSQSTSRNLVFAVAQKLLDRQRGRAADRRAGRVGEGEALRGVEPRREAGRAREVVPLLGRNADRLQRLRYARQRGAGTIRMRQELQDRLVRLENRTHAETTRAQRDGGALRYMIELGLPGDAAKARPIIERRIRQIEAARGGTRIPLVRRRSNDELVALRNLLDHPELLTPKLRALADEHVRLGEQLAAEDPALTAPEHLERRLTPQAIALGQEPRRGGVLRPVEPELRAARDQAAAAESAANGRVAVAQRALHDARLREKAAEDKARVLASTRRRAQRGGRVPKNVPDLTRRQGEVLLRAQGDRLVAERVLERVKREAAAARAERVRLSAAAENLPEFASEPVQQFAERVARAREGTGLAEPGYFKHERYFRPALSTRTHGSGAFGALAGPRRTEYTLFQQGRADVRVAPLYQEFARSIKRKYTWGFQAKLAEDFAVPFLQDAETGDRIVLRGKTKTADGRDVTVTGASWDQIQHAVERSGRDIRDFALFNPKVMLREAKGAADQEIDAAGLRGIGDAFAKASVTPGSLEDMAAAGREFRHTRGWTLIPRAVYQEMESSFKYQGLVGRLVRKYGKGVPSKIILGMNPSWEVIQVANNVVLAALGGVPPSDWAQANRFLRQNPDIRRVLEPEVAAAPFMHERHLAHVGSAVPNVPVLRDLLGYWQAFKQQPFMQRAGELNPMDWLFRADAANNKFFREAVAWNELKRVAYERMGRDIGGIGRDMRTVERLWSGPPAEVVRKLVSDPQVIDRIATRVNDVLGDWTTFTARERHLFEQNVMFYGFLRFSLRFALWTLPFKHPLVANIATNLSRLNEKEVRRLLGASDDDPLPFGALANYYYVKDGKLHEVGLGRLNPALNVLTQANTPGALLGVLPPIAVELANQIAGRNFVFSRDYQIRGNPAPVDARAQRSFGFSAVPAVERGRIALEDFLQQSAPYRIAEEMRFRGQPQGADSLLFSPRPLQYRSAQTVASIERSPQPSALDILLKSQAPFLPRVSQAREVTKTLREQRAENARIYQPRKGRVAPSGSGWGAPAQQKSGWGGSSSSKSGWGG